MLPLEKLDRAFVVLGRFSTGLPLARAMAVVPVGGSPGRETMSVEQFATTAEAMEALRQAQHDYERAALYLATNDTTNVEAAAEKPRARGLRLLYDEPKRGTADSRINFVHPKDAGGVLIELVEPPKPA